MEVVVATLLKHFPFDTGLLFTARSQGVAKVAKATPSPYHTLAR